MDDGPSFEGMNLVANDVDATVNFYRRLGVDIREDKIWRTATGAHHTEGAPLGPVAELEIDSQALARVYNAGYSEPSSVVIGFRMPSREAVDALFEELTAAGYAARQEPYDAFWGARYAIVADPDGRDVSFMSPVDPSFRSEPPQV